MLPVEVLSSIKLEQVGESSQTHPIDSQLDIEEAPEGLGMNDLIKYINLKGLTDIAKFVDPPRHIDLLMK